MSSRVVEPSAVQIDGAIWSRNFDASLPYAASVASGSMLHIQLHCCALGAVDRSVSTPPQEFYTTLHYTPGMPVTGPIEIQGAAVGDVLAVEILDIELAPVGWTMTLQDKGTLGHRMETGESRVIPIHEGRAWFTPEVGIPLRPMIGSIGTTPPGTPIRAGMVGPHGGNMDCTTLGAGAIVFLPVLTPGAGLALGDLHAVMGDGEVGVAGLEIAGAVHLRVYRLCDLFWPLPLLLSSEKVAVIYSAESLDEAAAGATERMADLICGSTGLSISEAAMFLSLAGDLRICQIVGALRTCRMEVDRGLLTPLGFDIESVWQNHRVHSATLSV